MPEEIIDSTVFLGMHSRDESMRRHCKGFFVERLAGRVTMSLEHVGRCDDLVWRYPRETQDAYYPFMDMLHTDMDIRRIGYTEEDIRVALSDERLVYLPVHERLLLGMTIRRDAVLHTASPRLRHRTDLPVRAVTGDRAELSFPDTLERLYAESRVLRVKPDDL
jgi:hypothetical protein